MDYKRKYLIYKKKYIELKKNQKGGAMEYLSYDINPVELKTETLELYKKLKTADIEEQRTIKNRIQKIKELMMIHNRMKTDNTTEMITKLNDVEPGIVESIKEFTYMPIKIKLLSGKTFDINVEIGNDESLKVALLKVFNTDQFIIYQKQNITDHTRSIINLLQNPQIPERNYTNLCFINQKSFYEFVNEYSIKYGAATDLFSCLNKEKLRIIIKGKQIDYKKSINELKIKPKDTLHIIYRLPIFFNLTQYWYIFHEIDPVSDNDANYCNLLYLRKGVEYPYIPKFHNNY